MTEVTFKKGLVSSLPSEKTEGCFYVTTDTGAIYLDTSASNRVYLNDPQKAEDAQATADAAQTAADAAQTAADNAQADVDVIKADYIKASEMVALTDDEIDELWNNA